MKELDLEPIKTALTDMGIPYNEDGIPENLMVLVKEFGYEASPLITDLTNVDTVDAELGVIVRNKDLKVDNGVYIFTVLHSGQAGFIVVQPGTVSRAPLVRKVTGDLIAAMTGVDLPPLTPFDMVEITGHLLAGTFMKTIMESCNIPEEYEQAFLNIYMPKFLANVGLYFTGMTKEDGSPMVYEETINMEPMIAWKGLMKGEVKKNEEKEKPENRTDTKGNSATGDKAEENEETEKAGEESKEEETQTS